MGNNAGGPSGGTSSSSSSSSKSFFGSQRQISVLNSMAGVNNGSEVSNGTDTAQTVRLNHWAVNDCTDLRVIWANYGGNPPTSGPGNFTITASIEYPAGTFTQLTFGGQASCNVPPGANVVSDPCPIYIPGQTKFWTRTCVAVVGGQGFTFIIPSLTPPNYGQLAGAVANVDDTLSGTIANSNSVVFGSYGLVGTSLIRTPAILLVGDSIGAGTNDYGSFGVQLGGDNYYGPTGVFGRAFGITNWPIISWAAPGLYASGFIPSQLGNQMLLMDACDYMICELGINDIAAATSLSTLQGYLVSLWKAAAARGVKVYQTTITPYTTSTDDWITSTNQTVTANEAVRVALNNWVRTIPAPLTGYFEIADLAETARNSGLWKPALQVSAGTSSGSNTTGTLHDTTQTWTANQFQPTFGGANYFVVQITGGTGAGQQQYIASNTGTVLTLANNWTGATPDATSTYKIFSPYTIEGLHGNEYSYPLLAAGINTAVLI